MIYTSPIEYRVPPTRRIQWKTRGWDRLYLRHHFVVLVFHSHRISSWIRIFHREWGPLSTNSNAALQPDSKRKSLHLVSWGDARGIRPRESSHSFAYPIYPSHVPTITARYLCYQITSRQTHCWTTCRPGGSWSNLRFRPLGVPAVTCSVNARGDHDRPKPAAV